MSTIRNIILSNSLNASLLLMTIIINTYKDNIMYKTEYQETSLSSRARSNFVTKVFSIVGIQLLVTTLFVGVNMNYPKIAKFQVYSTLLFWASIIGAIASMLVLSNVFLIKVSHGNNRKPSQTIWLGWLYSHYAKAISFQ